MSYQTGIRLFCVAQNPANGFPARLLGTGLSAMEHNHPLHVDWSEPNQGDGFLWWAVDDTTVTLADHYAAHTQVIDDLDAMNRSGATLQAMGEYLNRQPILPESRGERRPSTEPPTGYAQHQRPKE